MFRTQGSRSLTKATKSLRDTERWTTHTKSHISVKVFFTNSTVDPWRLRPEVTLGLGRKLGWLVLSLNIFSQSGTFPDSVEKVITGGYHFCVFFPTTIPQSRTDASRFGWKVWSQGKVVALPRLLANISKNRINLCPEEPGSMVPRCKQFLQSLLMVDKGWFCPRSSPSSVIRTCFIFLLDTSVSWWTRHSNTIGKQVTFANIDFLCPVDKIWGPSQHGDLRVGSSLSPLERVDAMGHKPGEKTIIAIRAEMAFLQLKPTQRKTDLEDEKVMIPDDNVRPLGCSYIAEIWPPKVSDYRSNNVSSA